MTLTATDGGSIHADTCGIVGCFVWIAVNTGSCLPYPCVCTDTKLSAPEYILRRGNVQCWWRDRDTGKIKSRCGCWGLPRDGRPGDCCAHHSANPLYSTPVVQGVAQAEEDPDVTGEHAGPGGPPPGETDDDPYGDEPGPVGRRVDANDTVPADWREAWPDEERKPYVRRWKPEEITCDCVLPYAEQKGTSALHCCTCDRDFGNAMAFEVHRKRWTDPCLDPADIVDCWTGAPLMVDAGGIWRLTFQSSYAPAGWTPGKFHTPDRRKPVAA